MSTPQQVADALKEAWREEPPLPLSPADLHASAFAAEVCRLLGVPATAENGDHVRYLMGKLKLVMETGSEYPKMVTTWDASGRIIPARYPVGHDHEGEIIVFHNAEEEAAYNTVGDANAAPAADTAHPAN